MITAIIICITVIICLFLILKWAHDMSTAGLPMFTYGECVQRKQDDDTPSNTIPIGFASVTDTTVEPTKPKTDKEVKEAYLADPITMTAALLRGEVDIDDVTN